MNRRDLARLTSSGNNYHNTSLLNQISPGEVIQLESFNDNIVDEPQTTPPQIVFPLERAGSPEDAERQDAANQQPNSPPKAQKPRNIKQSDEKINNFQSTFKKNKIEFQ